MEILFNRKKEQNIYTGVTSLWLIYWYEEAGSWKNFKKAFIQGDALVGIQGEKFGIKMAWGTGGDSGAALEGLADVYKHPVAYDVLPHKHNYTPDGDSTITGYFIPAYTIITATGMIDKRGWTDPVKGKEFYEKNRASKASDPEALIIYSAEYCFTAEEALALEGSNKFNKVLLTEQLARITLHKQGVPIQTGYLEYVFKGGVHQKQSIEGFKWIKDPRGKINIVEHPVWQDQEQPKVRGLYVAGIDSIDIGMRETSSQTRDPSDFCIVILKRAYGMQEPTIVAYYKDRPNDIREAYKIAIRMLEYYNCQANLEATRMSLITWARDHKYLHLFMKRPKATLPNILAGRSNQYGSPATPAVIDHQTDLIADFVNDYAHTIWFPDVLDELIRYNDANKTKFDIIAALGMVFLADEELYNVAPRREVEESKKFNDIGYYVDEYGNKRFGVIPDNTITTRASYSWGFGDEYNM